MTRVLVVVAVVTVVLMVLKRLLFAWLQGDQTLRHLVGLEGREVIKALERGEHRSLERVLRAADHDTRGFWLFALQTELPVAAIRKWVDAASRDPLPWIVLGETLLGAASRARGGAIASLVSRAQWEEQRACSVEAEQCFRRAIELDPESPGAWSGLLDSGLNLQAPREEIDARFARAIAGDPSHHVAHRRMLRILCKKWSGSHEEMFDFVRRVSAAAPLGSDLHLLQFYAHFERRLYFEFDDDPAGRAAYASDPKVRAELDEAYRRFVYAPRVRRSNVLGRNFSAGWFALIEDWPRLTTELKAIGQARAVTPWCWLGRGSSDKAWRAARASVGLSS